MAKHVCPIAACPELVDHDKVMCRGHWRLVPGDIQTKIYRSHTRSFGAGRSASVRARWKRVHAQNVRAAIDAVLAKITAGSRP